MVGLRLNIELFKRAGRLFQQWRMSSHLLAATPHALSAAFSSPIVLICRPLNRHFYLNLLPRRSTWVLIGNCPPPPTPSRTPLSAKSLSVSISRSLSVIICRAALEILTCKCLKWQQVHYTIIYWLLAVMTTPPPLSPLWQNMLGTVWWCAAWSHYHIPPPTPPYLTLSFKDWRDDIERRLCPLVRAIWGWSPWQSVSEINRAAMKGKQSVWLRGEKPVSFECVGIDLILYLCQHLGRTIWMLHMSGCIDFIECFLIQIRGLRIEGVVQCVVQIVNPYL